MNKIKYLFIFSTFILQYSCTFFTELDVRLDTYVKEIEANSENMSEKDWEIADNQIESFKLELQESKSAMTTSQIEAANKAIGRYAGIRIKNGIKNFGNELKDLGNQIEGAILELSDTLNN